MTNNEIVKSQEVLVEVFNFSQEKTGSADFSGW